MSPLRFCFIVSEYKWLLHTHTSRKTSEAEVLRPDLKLLPTSVIIKKLFLTLKSRNYLCS